jgi:hypothetical protein
MTRYFFNLYDGVSLSDTVGSEHPDLASVRSEAVETTAERLKGSLLKEVDSSSCLMNVTDEHGFTLMALSFSAAVQIVDQPSLAAARAAAE